MEEVQYYWPDLSDKQKLRIKKLLYVDYDFTKKNIDREIKNNVKRIYSYLDGINK